MGFGESLVFQIAPLVHAEIGGQDEFAANPIIIAISPVVSHMEDRTEFLRKFGISAGLIGEKRALNLKIEKGECSVVFLTCDQASLFFLRREGTFPPRNKRDA